MYDLGKIDIDLFRKMSECWMFYALPTARVIFTVEVPICSSGTQCSLYSAASLG